MNENDIITMLNKLAEFEDDRDAIEEEKRALLDDVKIPEEVEAIVKDGMNQVNEIGKEYASKIAAVYAEQNTNPFSAALEILRTKAHDKLNLIVIPEEIKAALAEIDRQRAEVTNALRDEEEKIKHKLDALAVSANARINALEDQAEAEKENARLEVEAQTKQVYTDIAQRKADIEAEFAGDRQAVDANIEKLKAEIKDATKEIGYTVQGSAYQAVYVKGRKTWNTKRLDVYVSKHPELEECFDVGDPSITIRKVK